MVALNLRSASQYNQFGLKGPTTEDMNTAVKRVMCCLKTPTISALVVADKTNMYTD